MRQAHKLTILIVDDHLLVRQGLKQVLQFEYRDIVFGDAGTAAEALAQIKAHPWRLVILDVSLPGDDGFSVLQEICARCPQTPVLMLSMHADSQYAARSLQLGAAGYISKSVPLFLLCALSPGSSRTGRCQGWAKTYLALAIVSRAAASTFSVVN